MLQPVSYDPLRDTISALAARGAADPWVMTAAIAAVGACYLVTALGLSPRAPCRASCARRRWRRDPVDCSLSDAASRLLRAARCCGDRGLHDHVCVAGTGRVSTTSSTLVEVRSECRRIRGHLRSDHVVHCSRSTAANSGSPSAAQRLRLRSGCSRSCTELTELSSQATQSSSMVRLTLPWVQASSWISTVVTSHAAQQRHDPFGTWLTLPHRRSVLGPGRGGTKFGSLVLCGIERLACALQIPCA